MTSFERDARATHFRSILTASAEKLPILRGSRIQITCLFDTYGVFLRDQINFRMGVRLLTLKKDHFLHADEIMKRHTYGEKLSLNMFCLIIIIHPRFSRVVLTTAQVSMQQVDTDDLSFCDTVSAFLIDDFWQLNH